MTTPATLPAKAAIMAQYTAEKEAHAAWLAKLRELAIEGYHADRYCEGGLNEFLVSEGLPMFNLENYGEYLYPDDEDSRITLEARFARDHGVVVRVTVDDDINESWYNTEGLQAALDAMKARHEEQRMRVRQYVIDHRNSSDYGYTDEIPGWFEALGLPPLRTQQSVIIGTPAFRFTMPDGAGPVDVNEICRKLREAALAVLPEGIGIVLLPAFTGRVEQQSELGGF